jgi:carbamate kinase
MTYWVIGGEYTDTSFTHIKSGDAEERIGPFRDYETAKSVWAKLAWQHVDDAHVRYRILHEESSEFWVVGGVYKSTDFSETIDGSPETKIGPFESYEQAKAAWQQKAWETVDDAHSRWRIEKVSR